MIQGPGWALDGPWMGPGWALDGPWMGHGWALDGPWMGSGWAYKNQSRLKVTGRDTHTLGYYSTE